MMLKHTYTLILLFVNVSFLKCLNETYIIEIAQNIIMNVFKTSSCISFINTKGTSNNILERALWKTAIPLISASNKKNDFIQKYVQSCGSIIASSDCDFLHNLSSMFKPHHTVAIISSCLKSSFTQLLQDTANLRGINIVTIESLIEPNNNTLYNDNKVNEAYFLKVTSLLENRILLEWNYEDVLELNEQDLQNIQWKATFSPGTYFKVSVFNCAPYVLLDPVRGVYDGVEYRMVKEITKNFPVRFKIYFNQTDDMNLWDKVIHDVETKESDIALCSHWYLRVLARSVDVSSAYGQVCVTFLVPKPQILPETTYILQPLREHVWIVIMFSLILLSVLLHLIAKFYTEMGMPEHPYSSMVATALDMVQSCAYAHLSHFLKVSYYSHLRIISILICILMTILSNAYSAGFTSLLAKPRYSRPVRTFEDMVEQNMHWTDYDDTLATFFKNSTRPALKQLSDLYVYVYLPERNKKIRKDNYAMISKSLGDNFVTETETLDSYGKTHLKILSDCFMDSYVVFPFAKDSPFINVFNKYITLFIEHGLIQHWYAEVRIKNDLTDMSPFFSFYTTVSTQKSPLSLIQIQGGFYLLLCGYAISVLVFLFELCIFQNLHLSWTTFFNCKTA